MRLIAVRRRRRQLRKRHQDGVLLGGGENTRQLVASVIPPPLLHALLACRSLLTLADTTAPVRFRIDADGAGAVCELLSAPLHRSGSACLRDLSFASLGGLGSAGLDFSLPTGESSHPYRLLRG